MNIETFFAIRQSTLGQQVQETIRRARFRDACTSTETSDCRAHIEFRVLLGDSVNETLIKFRNHPLS